MHNTCDARLVTARFLIPLGLALLLVRCGDSPTKPAPPTPSACSFQVAPATTNVGAAGGNVNITITTSAQCAWTAQVNAPWLSIVSGASGTGSGTAVVAGSANPDTTSRQGNVTVAQQTVTLTQAARDITCEYSTSLDSQRFGPDGGKARIQVTATPGCRWTATADANWITVSPADGTGNGEVTFTVAEWNGTDERSTAIRIGGRATIIRQDRNVASCAYSVDPVEFSLHWHETSGEIRVETAAGCPWSASSSDGWLGIPPTETSGSGSFRFSIAPLVAQQTRRAPVQVRWPTATQGQNVWVNQEGCYFAIGEREKTVSRDGGRFFLLVFGTPMSTTCQVGCPWTASSDVPWIQIQGSGNGVGDDGIFYVLTPNPGPGPRVGRITAAGFTLVITQSF